MLVWFLILFLCIMFFLFLIRVGEMLLSKVLEKLTRMLGLVFMTILSRSVGEKSKEGCETTVKGWNI